MIKTAEGRIRIRIQNDEPVKFLAKTAEELCDLPDADTDVIIGMEDNYRISVRLQFYALGYIDGPEFAAACNGKDPMLAITALVSQQMQGIRKAMLEAIEKYAKDNAR